jgi:positive regulator of sigma E activity
MKNIKIRILVFFIPLITIYLMVSFIELNFNICFWSKEERIISAVLGIFFAFGISLSPLFD